MSGFEPQFLRKWKMNCSGLQPCLENSGYLRVLGSTPTSSANMESNLIWRLGPPAKRVAPTRVWGSIPLFSATGKLSPMAKGSAWKARRAARHTVRFRSFPQTKSVCRIQYKQWRGVRVAEGARLESVCRSKAYRGFESLSLRSK